MLLSNILQRTYGKNIAQCSNEEIYCALLITINQAAKQKEKSDDKKKLYYICAEFLIGKLLSNNLINLGLYDEVKKELEENGKSIAEIEELENEPALGNGGLGRLAVCLLDSAATLGLCGDGIGLCYHFGLFKQIFKNNMQTAAPDFWKNANSPLEETDVSYSIAFKDFTISSKMYDIIITGYNGVVNRLHLFDAESADESIVHDGIEFDKTDIQKNLTLFLYPDDSDENGRLLRIYQEYFMASNAARLIIDESVMRNCKLYDLYDYAVIQINDTHPAMIIPELIRLLCERNIDEDKAIEIVRKSCAYTNHTILSEALEKWPLSYIEKVVPQIVEIIKMLDKKTKAEHDNPKLRIIDENGLVHMAHIAIHYSFSVNGVAQLHTNILKNEELCDFYKIYPEKFSNKTNGITFRRWLINANPELALFADSLIGKSWRKDALELEKLLEYKDDKEVLAKLLDIKQKNKLELKRQLLYRQGTEIDENSIFDIQIKRLHEYKRQQLNILYVICKYLEIKSGVDLPFPVTVIFGAKAAPAYTIAQDIIHLILCMNQLIENNGDVSRQLRVVMVENYNVSSAQMLIPACDISQQISLASKEASGTGNMKLMLNGAVTLGTADGANVEIRSLVGDDNIYIFGDSSDKVVKRYKDKSYEPFEYYKNNANIKNAIDFITGKEMMKIGNKQCLERLSNELKNKDWFMTFPDFDDYAKKRTAAYSDYTDRFGWAKKMLANIAMAGYFSSDRTASEYNRDIWRLYQGM